MGRFDRLPGIDGSNTRRRNFLVGGAYTLAGCVALGSVTSDPEEDDPDDNAAPADETDDTDPDPSTDDSDDVDDGNDEAEEQETEEVYLRLSAVDETDEHPPTDDAEVWIRGIGSWWVDMEDGSDVLEEAGPFERYDDTEGDIFVYPDGRDGVEIPVVVYFDEDFQSGSDRDLLSIEIHDREVQIMGSPVEAYHDEFTVSLDRSSPDDGPASIGEMSALSQNTDWFMDHVEFSGEGQRVTDAFEASYFTSFVYDHDGSSNFQVELIDNDSGETVEYLVNKIGDVSGAVGVGLEVSEYIMDINADGAWAIELGEPYAPDDEYGVPPGTIAGEQPDVYGEIDIDGRVTVSGQHEGDSNFIVQAWAEGSRGSFSDGVIFNEIGEFSGETSVQLNGLFYIEVEADGPYRITIE